MKMSGVFSSHLKAEELGPGKRVTVTIDDVRMEKVGDEQKPVLYFVGKDKGLSLNKTNTNAIIDILGSDDSDDWAGKKIVLYTTKVDYQGKRVLAIRVDEAPKPAKAATAVAATVERSEDDSPVEADEIPF